MSKPLDIHPYLEPFNRLQRWVGFYRQRGVIDSNAMALATVNQDNFPSVRMVLMKGVDDQGIVFYTNMESRKGHDIKQNPNGALLFYWREPGRQIRVEGSLETVSDDEADAYFHSRDRGSQIGAWASKQSRPLESRFALEKEVAKWAAKFSHGPIQRPPYWTGQRLKAKYFEFWQAGKFRLHRRDIYKKTDNGWYMDRLYP